MGVGAGPVDCPRRFGASMMHFYACKKSVHAFINMHACAFTPKPTPTPTPTPTLAHTETITGTSTCAHTHQHPRLCIHIRISHTDPQARTLYPMYHFASADACRKRHRRAFVPFANSHQGSPYADTALYASLASVGFGAPVLNAGRHGASGAA